MLNSLLKTQADYAVTIARILFSFVISAHGAQKLFGWFGGYGLDATLNYFTGTVGVPWALGLLVVIAESIGAVALAFGIFSRFISASLAIIMFVAASTHIQNGFFMNFFGNQPGEGVEYFILAIALALVMVIKGGGALSVDLWLYRKKFGWQNRVKSQLA